MYRFLILFFLSTMAGCATTPGHPTPLRLDIEVAEDANPDDGGRPSPVVLSIFDLAMPERFSRSNYLTLLSAPEKCLRGDLLGSHRTNAIAPGTQRTIELTAEPSARHVGIIAELVQFPDAKTRVDVPLRPNRLNRVKLRIDSAGIRLRNDDRPRLVTQGRFNDD